MEKNPTPTPEELGIEPNAARERSALEKRPPSLYWTEGKLAEAHRALETAMETRPEMTADEAEAFVQEIIPSLAVTSNRDAFARFVLEAGAQAEAKNRIAEAYMAQANRIKKTLDTMTSAVVRSMRAEGVEKLAGAEHVLRVKTGPPRVEVDDEALIPEAFMRFARTAEGERIERLFALLVEVTVYGRVEMADADAAIMAEALELRLASLAERRAPDKNAIKDAWKEAGSDVIETTTMVYAADLIAIDSASALLTPDQPVALTTTTKPVPVVPGNWWINLFSRCPIALSMWGRPFGRPGTPRTTRPP